MIARFLAKRRWLAACRAADRHMASPLACWNVHIQIALDHKADALGREYAKVA